MFAQLWLGAVLPAISTSMFNLRNIAINESFTRPHLSMWSGPPSEYIINTGLT